MKIGEAITLLRRQKKISQKDFAEKVGVPVSTVLKWENGYAMPAFACIPAIAATLGVSEKEIVDTDGYDDEASAICQESGKYFFNDTLDKAEGILREGLERFPEDEAILINLLNVFDCQYRFDTETLALCKKVLKFKGLPLNIKYAAYRILANCYCETEQYDKIPSVLNKIPDMDFTKRELEALLLEGEERYTAANKEKYLSAHDLVDMLMILGQHWEEQGERDKALSQFMLAKRVIAALEDDFFDPEYATETVYEQLKVRQKELNQVLRRYKRR